jgi:general secretion pathway protein L
MTKFFLFIGNNDFEQIPSIALANDGAIVHDYALRTVDEIKALQATASLYIVIATHNASITNAEIPLSNVAKLRLALPNYLEDNIAQEIEDVHISFDAKHKQGNNYEVVIIDKQYLQAILAQCNQHKLLIDGITLDYFAVPKDSAYQLDTNILINSHAFKGSLEHSLYEQLKTNFEQQIDLQQLSKPYQVEIAKRLNQSDFINLCQGEMQIKKASTMSLWKVSALVICLWAIVLFSGQAIKYFWLKRQVSQLDIQVVSLYKQFFPKATQVIRPKFRIENILKQRSQGNSEANFFAALYKIGPIIKKNTAVQVTKLEYSRQKISIDLQTAEFAQLAALQQQLKANNVNIKQKTAGKDDGLVKARWEISL